MSCGKKALLVMLLTGLLGLWGCTQGGGSSTTSARLRELEARSARLEDDYKTAAAARDQARKKVTALEDQRTQLAQQVEQLLKVAKERDELRTQLTARVAEREALQANLVQFSRDLQNLATKLEQAAGGSAAPLLSAPPTPATPPSPAS
jgi:chromosome segregation ATPase